MLERFGGQLSARGAALYGPQHRLALTRPRQGLGPLLRASWTAWGGALSLHRSRARRLHAAVDGARFGGRRAAQEAAQGVDGGAGQGIHVRHAERAERRSNRPLAQAPRRRARAAGAAAPSQPGLRPKPRRRHRAAEVQAAYAPHLAAKTYCRRHGGLRQPRSACRWPARAHLRRWLHRRRRRPREAAVSASGRLAAPAEAGLAGPGRGAQRGHAQRTSPPDQDAVPNRTGHAGLRAGESQRRPHPRAPSWKCTRRSRALPASSCAAAAWFTAHAAECSLRALSPRRVSRSSQS